MDGAAEQEMTRQSTRLECGRKSVCIRKGRGGGWMVHHEGEEEEGIVGEGIADVSNE